MEIKEAIKILKEHNEWRRGADTPMAEPKLLGEAIDLILESHEEMAETLLKVGTTLYGGT